MSVLLFMLGLASQPNVTEKAILNGRAICIVSRELETPSKELRPSPEIDCDYGAAEFRRRLLSMFRWPAQGLNIDIVERTFSLPRLKTAYDAPRQAAFTAFASGSPGNRKWSVSLEYSESFAPMDAYRRPRFRGSERPVLINPRIRGDRRVLITIFSGPKDSAPPEGCLGPSDFRHAARFAGWTEDKNLVQPPPSHGQTLPPSLSFRRGRWGVGVSFDAENKCATRMVYGTEADPGAN